MEIIKIQLKEYLYRAVFIYRDQMFFDITDYYRDKKVTIKTKNREMKINSIEIIPIDEIPEKKDISLKKLYIRGDKKFQIIN